MEPITRLDKKGRLFSSCSDLKSVFSLSVLYPREAANSSYIDFFIFFSLMDAEIIIGEIILVFFFFLRIILYKYVHEGTCSGVYKTSIGTT